MNAQLFEALQLLEKTKGIPVDYMIGKIEAALVSAYKKQFGNTNVRIDINKTKKDMKVYRRRNVVEEVSDPETEISLEDARKLSKRYEIGSVVENEIKLKDFGRISAQTAKQVIIQGIREAEKDNLIREYERKREEVISALVSRRDDNTGDVWVDTGTSEVILPRSEQIPGEELYVGDRVRVFVTEVTKSTDNTPIITISRVAPAMIKRMFEQDIPEIADGLVIVKNVSREPGSRTKISVYSRDEDVDAVGACIGNRGTRISAIVEELRGEKIDIIQYSEHPEEYIAAALSPASVLNVEFDGERSSTVMVASDQLSLAIGKEGQNVRLAAKLTGFKIDIKGTKEA
ncbi:MAG: transcription termination/antitermination protein NusA [Clostridia bacterium]|jgi:N utilization substance protein A|nr:transcription termination/antitermination protein NusA [Clostridia bacterium]